MAFNERLKSAREVHGFSRKDLAEKIGTTVSAISNYENGVSSPKTEILYKIFAALEVEPNYLFQDEMSVENTVRQDGFFATGKLGNLLSYFNRLDEMDQENLIAIAIALLSNDKYKDHNQLTIDDLEQPE